ncbi:LADA_0H13608g1_1 [Lachancea dasiensis]|uniref:LADA_0H13608g1_1 n=1 Tax=Lachancea dasiensis TaxID=1072105 RepID=A0A1G4K468_9SACH|nr:LADA_0H13608g1_1 [Lachancea dasiensis]
MTFKSVVLVELTITHSLTSVLNNMSHFSRRYLTGSASLQFLGRLQKHLANTAPKEHVVKELVRPIGLASPPEPQVKYKEGNSVRELFDDAKTTQRARELELQFSKGGLYDVYTFRKTNGKLFLSPPSFWKQEKAQYFPHLVGRTLASSQFQDIETTLLGKVSVVRIFTSAAGDSLGKSYFKSEEDVDYLKNESPLNSTPGTVQTQIVEINFTENKLKALFARLAMGQLRSGVPAERHSRYFLADRNQLPFGIREQLQINNLYTSYVLVVDPQLKIRWMGCGGADKKEFNLLWRCVRGLQKEESIAQ